MILGCDAAGIDPDGNEVIVHSVISTPDWTGDETLDPRRSLLSERHQGTLAERVVVPRRNLVPKPASLSFEEAACLPTAWLTAYRMLFVQSGARPGDTVLVQGAGGGVATALIVLARAGGFRAWVTSRERGEAAAGRRARGGRGVRHRRPAARTASTPSSRPSARRRGATRSSRCVPAAPSSSPAPRAVPNPPAELNRVFFLQLRVVGSTMGTRHELLQLAQMLDVTGVRPLVDRVLPLADAREGFALLASGDVFGKVVLTS